MKFGQLMSYIQKKKKKNEKEKTPQKLQPKH